MATILFGIPSGPTLLIVAFIALLLFGNRIPQLAKSLGQGVTEFKKGLNTDEDEEENEEEENPKKLKKGKKSKQAAEDSEDEEA